MICGDADGDGDPNAPGTLLPTIQPGTTDHPNFSAGEVFGLVINTNNDDSYDVVVGVPLDATLDQISVYEFLGPLPDVVLETDFWGNKLANVVSLFGQPSASAPDLEFSIANFSSLPNTPQGMPVIAL